MPPERRPDGLDSQRITGTLYLGVWVFKGDKGHKLGIVRSQTNPDQRLRLLGTLRPVTRSGLLTPSVERRTCSKNDRRE